MAIAASLSACREEEERKAAAKRERERKEDAERQAEQLRLQIAAQKKRQAEEAKREQARRDALWVRVTNPNPERQQQQVGAGSVGRCVWRWWCRRCIVGIIFGQVTLMPTGTTPCLVGVEAKCSHSVSTAHSSADPTIFGPVQASRG